MNNLTEITTETQLPTSFFEGTDIQVSTAKKYPRNIKKCLEEAEEMALLSEDIAASCFYNVPRAGKNIQGASVRLAEIFTSAWGNLHMASEIKENNGSAITARAYCWDLEKNIKAGVEIKKSVLTKEGRRFSQDMQTVVENASMSIALRNAIFKVIPRGYIDALLEKCQNKALGNSDSEEKFASKRAQVFEKFNALGIENKRIFSFFGKVKMEDFNLEDIKNMIGVGTAIKDGILKVEEAFQIEKTKSDELAERLGKID